MTAAQDTVTYYDTNHKHYAVGDLWLFYEHIYRYNRELIIKNAKKFFAIKHILDEYFMEHNYENDISFRTSFLDEYTCVPYELRRKRNLYSFNGSCNGSNNIYTWFHYRVIEALKENYVFDDKDTYRVISESKLDEEIKDELRSIISNKIDINDKNIDEIRRIAKLLNDAFFYDIYREYIESDIVEYTDDFDAGYMTIVFLILLKNGFPSDLPFKLSDYTIAFDKSHNAYIDRLLFTDILMSNMESSNENILSALLANDNRLLNDLCESDSSLLCKSLPQ